MADSNSNDRSRGNRDRNGSGNRSGGRGERSGDNVRRNAQGRERNRGGRRDFSASQPSARRRSSDPARRVAWQTLRAVSADDAYANLVLPARLRQANITGRDAGFATELAYGALRSQGTYDAILQRCTDRPLKEIDPEVLDALRLGCHQLFAMRVPDHAALSETVALVRDEIGAGPSGFVNAVLRRASERSLDEWLDELTRDADPTEAAALRHSHPAWIVRALRQALVNHGRSADELTELLAADNAAPMVQLVALPGLGDLAEARAAGATDSELLQDAASITAGDLAKLESVRDGVVRVQDVGSQIVARALLEAPLDGPDGRWLDVCAGPGGKAALAAALAVQHDAELVANEPAEHRAGLVRTALGPINDAAWTVTTDDGRDIGAEHPGEFDRVLVDVPCSGLGALRRRPESRWRRTPADIAQLGSLQRDLLRSSIAATRPGGLIAYVTCSPHPAETTAVVDDVLRKNGDVELLDTPAAIDAVTLKPADAGAPRDQGDGTGPSTAQLWPHVHGTDAMFMALLRKKLPKTPEQQADTTPPTDGDTK